MINRLPREQRAGPIEQLSQRIEHIRPQRDRFEALSQVCDATRSLQEHMDCGAIVKHLPHAVESLSRKKKIAGYALACRAVTVGLRFGMDDGSSSASLSGLARILPQLPESGIQMHHATEVGRIFAWLETLPTKHRTGTLERLCEDRFRLSPDAANIVTQRALQATASDRCTSDQRIAITDALILGLVGIPHPDPRFDGEFVTLYQASRNQADSQARITMLQGLSSFQLFDRLSPAVAEKMQGAIRSDLDELEKTDPAEMDAQFVGVIDQFFAAMRSPESDPAMRAHLMTQIAANFHVLSDRDQAGQPMTNPRVMVYMRLGERLLHELGTANENDSDHQQALAGINHLMVQGRQYLKPAELQIIDDEVRKRGFTPPGD